MARRQIKDSRAIVTGASSGIGAAISRKLAFHGGRVIITARRRDRLEALANQIAKDGSEVHVCSGDITDPAHRERLLEVAQSKLGGLDLLINNAGVGAVGPFLNAEPDRLRRIMEVNFFAVAEMIRSAQHLLREGRNAAVVNIGSVLGHRAVPSKSEYCASKFALHGLSDSIRAEFSNDRIDVILISPSTTDSEFFEQMLEDQGTVAKNPYGMTPERVADIAVAAIRRGRHEVILSWSGRLLVWLDRLLPSVANRLVERFG